jgi:hypothetical protein
MAEGRQVNKGDNLVQCALRSEINHALNMLAGTLDQKKAFTLVYCAISGKPLLRDIIEKKYGHEKLDELLEHYQKTTFDQKQERELEAEAKKIMDEAKQKVAELKARGYVKQVKVSEQNTALKKKKQKLKLQETQGKTKLLNEEYERLEAEFTDLVKKGHVWRHPNTKEVMISGEEDRVNGIAGRIYAIQEELGKLGAEVPPQLNVESIAEKLGKTIFDKP